MAEKSKDYLSTISMDLDVFNSQTVLVKTENYKLQVNSDERIPEKTYDPHEHRSLEHPNNFTGAFVHIIKSSLGTGILAIPNAFKSAGLLVGIIGNILIGILCTHTVYILVQASNKVSSRAKIPSLGYADTAGEVFRQGPKPIRKWAGFIKLFTEFALVTTYYLSVAVYMVFISVSLTKLFSFYYPETKSWDQYIFKLMIMALLLVLCQIREIKHLVPFSFVANVLMFVAFGITGYYIFSGLHQVDRSKLKLANGISGFPSFFATVLFAMEGIGSIMPIENSLPKPVFLGTCGVLNAAMSVVVVFFTAMGGLGYYRFGEDTQVAITANLPDADISAQVAQGAIAISVFFSFMLQFYVPTEILWNRIKKIISKERHNICQIVLRIVLIISVTVVAILGGQHLSSLIDLTGAIFFSTLGFLMPALLDIIVNWNDWGTCYWLLIKNIFIIILAVFGLISGTYNAIADMLK